MVKSGVFHKKILEKHDGKNFLYGCGNPNMLKGLKDIISKTKFNYENLKIDPFY